MFFKRKEFFASLLTCLSFYLCLISTQKAARALDPYTTDTCAHIFMSQSFNDPSDAPVYDDYQQCNFDWLDQFDIYIQQKDLDKAIWSVLHIDPFWSAANKKGSLYVRRYIYNKLWPYRKELKAKNSNEICDQNLMSSITQNSIYGGYRPLFQSLCPAMKRMEVAFNACRSGNKESCTKLGAVALLNILYPTLVGEKPLFSFTADMLFHKIIGDISSQIAVAPTNESDDPLLKIHEQFWNQVGKNNKDAEWHRSLFDKKSEWYKINCANHMIEYISSDKPDESKFLNISAFCYQHSMYSYLFYDIDVPIYTNGQERTEQKLGTLPAEMKNFDGLEYISNLSKNDQGSYSMFTLLKKYPDHFIHKFSQYEFRRLYKRAKGKDLPLYSKAYMDSLLIQSFKEHFNL